MHRRPGNPEAKPLKNPKTLKPKPFVPKPVSDSSWERANRRWNKGRIWR